MLRLLIIWVISCASMHIFGQSQYPSERALNIIPQSPGASSILAFGNTPVTKFTGAPQISIPFHNVEAGSFSLPLTLSYKATGVKVEEIASSYGMGWNMAIGGVITKTIRGLSDDMHQGYSNGYSGSLVNQYVSDLLSPTNRRNFQFGMTQGHYDGEPDVFSYSFGNYQGEFIFRADSSIIQRYGAPLKIEVNYAVWPAIPHFIITDPNGVKYYFQDLEQTQSVTTFAFDGVISPLDPKVFTSAWHLSRIEVPSGEEILFDYITSAISPTYLDPVSLYYRIDPHVMDCNGIVRTKNLYVAHSSNLTNITQKKINTVTFPAGEIQVFYQNTNRTDLSGDKAIQQIVIKDKNSETVNSFTFTHAYFSNRLFLTELLDANAQRPYLYFYDQATSLPAITSMAQDYWGFYNGKSSNTTLIPAVNHAALNGINLFSYTDGADREPDFNYMKHGILNRIKYPTGGETMYTYESHRYGNITGEIWVADTIRTISNIVDAVTAGPSGWSEKSFVIDFGQEIHISSTVSGHNVQTQVTNPVGLPIFGHYSDGSSTPQTLNHSTYVPAGTYKLRAFNYEDEYISRIQVVYQKQLSSTIAKDKAGGGLRIREITDYTAPTQIASKRSYQYKRAAEPDRSSGILVTAYVHDYMQKMSGVMLGCIPDSYSIDYYARLSSPAVPLYTSLGSHVEYSEVLEIRESAGSSNGKTVTRYTSSLEPSNRDYNAYSFPFVAPVSREYRRGHIQGEQTYKGAGDGDYTLIREVHQEYAPHPSSDVVYGTSIALHVGNPTINSSLNTYIGNSYGLYRDFFALASKTVKSYDSSPPVENRTDYYYDNYEHYQVSRISLSTSTGSKETTFISYAPDYLDGSGFIGQLKNAHQIALPIERVVYRETGGNVDILEGMLTTYKNGPKGLADEILSLRSIDPVNLSAFKVSNRVVGQLPPSGANGYYTPDSRYAIDIRFPTYGDYGNVVEVIEQHKATTTYLWGYDSQYPVAELRNASYAQVVGIIGIAGVNQLKSPTVSDLLVRSTIQSLRSGLPQSQVRTFTHKPLVGVSSMTDARGNTEYYQYDSYRRLHQVLDFESKLLKRYQYHIKP